jgi:ABC-2 type transport system ATP-binding protein
LVSSHILAEVAQMVDNVVILDRGRMVAHAPLEQLAATAGVEPVVRIRTPKAEELRAAVVADGAHAQVAGPEIVEVTGTTPERIGELAADRAIPVYESTTEVAGLEEIFFQLTARPNDKELLR